MGAHHFEELDASKLANELKLRVYQLVDRPTVARDFKFRDQITDSAASAPRNIAEGFSNHLRDGVDRRHFTTNEIADLQILAKRASTATTRLMRYLKTATPPRTLPRKTRAPRTKNPENENPST